MISTPLLAACALLAFQGDSSPGGRGTTPPPSEAPSRWTFEVTPYVWLLGMSGEVRLGSASAPINETFEDLFEVTDVGGSLHVEASKKPWVLFGDVLYGEISVEDEAHGFEAEVENTTTIAELGAGYSFDDPPWLQVIGGGRLFDFSTDLEVTAPGPLGTTVSESEDQTWVDPFVGVRVGTDLDEKWFMYGRADFGGFGLGSQFTVNLMSGVAYSVSDTARIHLGYRVFEIDYERGTGDDRFEFDGRLSGIFTAISFRF